MTWWLQLSELVRNAGLVLAGAFGLYLAWLRVTAANRQAEAQVRQAEATARQAELGQQKLITDLFGTAVAQLGSDKLEVRLLAVYTLRRIAETSPDYRQPVLDLLAAYMRENSRNWDTANLPVDVREIVQTISASLK